MDSPIPHPLSAQAPNARNVVVGAPGSGKTTLLVERLRGLVEAGVPVDSVVMLTASRQAASALRDRVGLALGRASQGPRVRSVASLAFAIVQAGHAQQGLPAPDVLSASQIDADIQALLEGHLEDGTGPDWPDPLTAVVRGSTPFRTELREWMARAIEAGLTPEAIRSLAGAHQRPQWAAAADFWDEFRLVRASSRPASFDSAEIVRRAALLVRQDCPRPFDTLVHVCVDDAMDLTVAGFDLLHAFAERGVGVTIAGDPDVAGNTFRGSHPESLAQCAIVWAVQPIVLSAVFRHGESLRRCLADVSSRVGTAGFGAQRQAPAVGGTHTEVFTLEAAGPRREANDIARLVAQAHRDQGVALGDIAVIARRSQSVGYLAGELARAGIPTRLSHTFLPLSEQPAVRELLDILAVGRGLFELTPDRAVSLLCGRYLRMTPQQLRRLRFHLRIHQDPHAPYSSADALLAQALGHRGGFADIPPALSRAPERLARMLDEIAQAPAHTPVTELLWSTLEHTGVVESWRRLAGEDHGASPSANRWLDSLVALFAHAAEWVDAHPGASLDVYLDDVLAQAVPDDVVLSEPGWDAVSLATPAQVVGRQFRVVVVAGLEEGVWPDLRLRGSLLAAHHLAPAARGEIGLALDERKIIRDDELRMFLLALSRASDQVVVTASANDDTQPSPLFRILQEHSTTLDSHPEPPESLRGEVGRLRRELADAGGEDPVAAAGLAALAQAGVPGANPDSWWGLLEQSSREPLFHGGDIPVSPSRIETIEESPVEWFLDTIAQSDTGPERGLGTLIHSALEAHPAGDAASLWAEVENRFDQLEYDAGWITEYHRRLARGMVDALAEYLDDRAKQGHQLVASEARFEIRHGLAVVTGKIDRIEQDSDGGLLVIDLKTGAAQTEGAVVDHPQMLTYQLGVLTEQAREAYQLGDAALRGAALLFVKSGVRGKRYRLTTQDPVTPETIEQTYQRIENAAMMIAQAQFVGGPRRFGDSSRPGRHRWHFVGQVPGDD